MPSGSNSQWLGVTCGLRPLSNVLIPSVLAALVLSYGGRLHARPSSDTSPIENVCISDRSESGADAATKTLPTRTSYDWAWLCRYREDNRRILSETAPDMVFIGDSITEHWVTANPEFFGERRVGRGISGQTSAQMLLRFYQDAVALKPKVIHLLAGSNDIARNSGALDPIAYQNNVRAMVDLACANNITVVIGTILPAKKFYWRNEIQPAKEIRKQNQWLKDFAARRKIRLLDYHSGMVAPDGGMRDGLSNDGVHPNHMGYTVMREIAEPVLTAALAKAKHARGAHCRS